MKFLACSFSLKRNIRVIAFTGWIYCTKNIFTLPWKQSLPWIKCIEYAFFIIQDFWTTCACPENRVCPENFQDRGGGRPPRPPASYAYADRCQVGSVVESEEMFTNFNMAPSFFFNSFSLTSLFFLKEHLLSFARFLFQLQTKSLIYFVHSIRKYRTTSQSIKSVGMW